MRTGLKDQDARPVESPSGIVERLCDGVAASGKFLRPLPCRQSCVVTCVCSAGTRVSGALGCTQIGQVELTRLVEALFTDTSELEVLEQRTRCACPPPLETSIPLETSSLARLEQQVCAFFLFQLHHLLSSHVILYEWREALLTDSRH